MLKIIENTQSLNKGLRWIYRCAKRTICNVYLHLSVDFDFQKYLSENNQESPQIIAFSGSKASLATPQPNETILHAFNWPHTCDQATSTNIKVAIAKDGCMDKKYFQNLIEANPYATLSFLNKKQSLMASVLRKEL